MQTKEINYSFNFKPNFKIHSSPFWWLMHNIKFATLSLSKLTCSPLKPKEESFCLHAAWQWKSQTSIRRYGFSLAACSTLEYHMIHQLTWEDDCLTRWPHNVTITCRRFTIVTNCSDWNIACKRSNHLASRLQASWYSFEQTAVRQCPIVYACIYKYMCSAVMEKSLINTVEPF